MVGTIVTAVVVIFLTVMLHFNALKLIAHLSRREHVSVALRLTNAVYLLVLAHFAEVVIFAVGYFIATSYFDAGTLRGEFNGQPQEYIYYSLVSYSSLGFGDVYPQGPIRLLTGLEALTGLLMIGWSASFTYIFMSKYWRDL